MAITKGKWEVTKWVSHDDVHVSIDEGSYMRFICNCGNPVADTLPTNPNAEADANIIVTAVNACQSVNQDNPMAVAESIKDMYEALATIISGIDRDCDDSNPMFSFHMDSPLADTLRQAKAKAERRE